jgi:hypothetical protein
LNKHVPFSGPRSTVAFIDSLTNLLSASAKALTTFGDSIAHFVKLGALGYSSVVNRQARSRLIKIRAQLELITTGPSMNVVKSIDDYVERLKRKGRSQDDIAKDWYTVTQAVNKAIRHVSSVLGEVHRIRNDFVLEEAYRHIYLALFGRKSLLDHLRRSPLL